VKLIDTHTHLYIEDFDQDRDDQIELCIKNGVHKFFLPAIDMSYTKRMLGLKAKYPKNIFLMSGLHPTHVKEDYKNELKHVEQNLKNGSFCAVGEIGIDLYWDKTNLSKQQEAFNQQIIWAKEYDLPIVIHCRDAFDEVFDVLENHKSDKLRGIFHCFTGDLDQAQRAIGFNMKLGIGGVVTFKNGKIDKFIKEIPIESIVLETDSPYLAPVPYRGKRNESNYLPIIAKKVAECYDLPIEFIANKTSESAKLIFNC
jgi:TatD DNase family protein|tara:strand:- start:361 stop:1128 length:768 start_codon:yes stop_codon:yes gene_type:complete